MKHQVLEEGPLRTYAVVFDTGDRLPAALLEFAAEEGIDGASLTAIGAFQEATLAFFDLETREYLEIPVAEQAEVLTLAGNLGLHGEEPLLHAHAVLGLRDGTTRGGHLLSATVRPTLEVVITETGGTLRRTVDEETGLPLIDPSR